MQKWRLITEGKTVVLICAVWLFSGVPGAVFAEDGPPVEFAPLVKHELVPIGTGQDVLVICVQADDYRILSADLATLNANEEGKTADAGSWFEETSWDKCTLNLTLQRKAGNEWYLLPEGILDYCSPSGIKSMEARDATEATAVNPTPPASVSAAVSADASSEFDADSAGDYWYAVSTFKNGKESTLTKINAAVAVGAGDVVELTITRAAASDADRYIIYRTPEGSIDNLQYFFRIGYQSVTGASDTYKDTGKGLLSTADHWKLLEAAMEVADTDVADYEDYDAVIVIIHSAFLRGQAGQASTFDINGTEVKIETINLSSVTTFGRYSHEIGHLIDLPDEYDPVTQYPRGIWTAMDGSGRWQYCAWEKERLGWISEPGNIKYLERPGPGQPDHDGTYKVIPTAVEDTQPDSYTALKIKSTDTVNYYSEGRDSIVGHVSDTGASDDVVIMECADVWPVGIYPKRNVYEQLKELESGDPAFQPDPTVTLTYIGKNLGPPETYNVRVEIQAMGQPDPKITPWGAPPWHTPDIWVDSEREGGGFDEDPGNTVTGGNVVEKAGNGEAAWVGHVNRVYAKVTNVGAVEAKDVQVYFRVCQPGGMGDCGQFVDLQLPAPITIPAGGHGYVYAEWEPTVGEHTCINVEARHIPGEADTNNNFAQENITHFYSGSSSPWAAVEFPVIIANPFEEPKRVDIEVEGMESGWKVKVDHKWVMLDPLSSKTVNVSVLPPPAAEECTEVALNIYGLIEIDDFIQVYGGISPVIHLADPLSFRRIAVELVDETKEGFVYEISGVAVPAPPEDNNEIAIILTGPHVGYEVVFTETDASGYFKKHFTMQDGGGGEARAYFAGSDCIAPTESDPLKFTVGEEGLGLNRWGSLHGGIAIPTGNFGDYFDPGFNVIADVGYRIPRSDYALYAMLGYNGFPSSIPKVPDTYIINFNVNVRRWLQVTGPFYAYAGFGPGYYRFKNGANLSGANAGLGIDFRANPNFAFEVGGDWHMVFDPGDTRFAHIHLGVLFPF